MMCNVRIDREVHHMTQARRDTATFQEIMKARLRLNGRRQRWAWAVQFAQEPLDGLSRGKKDDLRLELTAFADWAGGTFTERGKDIPLFTDEDIHHTQRRFKQIVDSLFDNGSAKLGPYHQDLGIMTKDGIMYLTRQEGAREMGAVERAVYALGLLLNENEDLPKACPAPKARGAEGEQCGRRFVGRPNQVYCTALCQNRATTRAARAKQSSSTGARERRRRTCGHKEKTEG
jgi:hypothetical protein